MSKDIQEIEKKRKFVNIFHNPLTAWVVLIISLILTITAYHFSNKFVIQRSEDRFNFRVEEVMSAIEDRMNVYEQALWGGVALFNASNLVERDEWYEYVKTLKIDENWPGIQGMGFSVPVATKEKEEHLKEIREQGFPDYTIKPEGKREEYSAIIYLEPFDWRNKRAFGYDMWSNDMRRAAMKRSRDEGVAATSGIITLVQETDDDVQRGFLTYLPVYKSREALTTVEERRKNFSGWVYSPFRAGDLMKGIIGTEDANIDFEIFDGETMTTDSLLYDSNAVSHLLDNKVQSDFSQIKKVVLQGRPWTIYFHSRPGYLGQDKIQPRLVALAGVIVDIFLFYIIYSIYFLQKRVSVMAQDMTVELQEQTKELEATKKSLEIKVQERTKELESARVDLETKIGSRTSELQKRMQELEQTNKSMVDREIRMVELKKENEDLYKRLEQKNNK